MAERNTKPAPAECRKELLIMRDTIQLLSGKWKAYIIGALLFNERMRFMDLLREVDGIKTKMLSKELLELEQNKLVHRVVMNTRPVTVEYSLTEHGKTLEAVLKGITQWGTTHRKIVLGQ